MTIEIDFNQFFWASLALGVLVGVIPIAIAPYLLRLIVPKSEDAVLPRSARELIFRYIYGTTSILLGGGIFVALIGLWWIVLAFLAVALGCGIVVALRYGSADISLTKRQNDMQHGIDPDLKK